MPSRTASAPELLAAYDEQVRRRPVPDGPDDVVEQADGVVRCVSETGWSGVTYSDLAGRDGDAAIAAQVARIPGTWEWKHHSYDEPSDLPERLLAAGFEAEETEALMFADLRTLAIAAPLPSARARSRLPLAAGRRAPPEPPDPRAARLRAAGDDHAVHPAWPVKLRGAA